MRSELGSVNRTERGKSEISLPIALPLASVMIFFSGLLDFFVISKLGVKKWEGDEGRSNKRAT